MRKNILILCFVMANTILFWGCNDTPTQGQTVLSSNEVVENSSSSQEVNDLVSSSTGVYSSQTVNGEPSSVTESSNSGRISSLQGVSSENISSETVSSDNGSSVDISSADILSSSEEISSADMSIGINSFEKIEVEINENTSNNAAFKIVNGHTEYFSDNNYLKFSDVNFGNGVNKVTLRLATENTDAIIELRIDTKEGTLIGTIEPSPTGGWARFESQSSIIEDVEGLHDLYVIGTDRITVDHEAEAANIDFLQFSKVETLCNAGEFCDAALDYTEYTPTGSEIVIPRSDFIDRLGGLWLGACLANWTGIVTEMDHVEPPFYVYSDWGMDDPIEMFGTWGQPRLPFYNGGNAPKIDFVYVYDSKAWASDDDTNIEYIYQHILDKNNTSVLTGAEIRNGWLKHINREYVWVSNRKTYDNMVNGLEPPATSAPYANPDYEAIDAQLTTEIFGMFSPAHTTVALDMARLPILASARYNAQWISEFYVVMYSLAAYVQYHDEHTSKTLSEKLTWLAEAASKRLPANSFSRDMYDFVKNRFDEDPDDWEATRNAVYERYQLGWHGEIQGGYYFKGRSEAGINFAAGMISFFYGKGDAKEIIKIGSLSGWDCDNPTATWGGLIGFLMGQEKFEEAFGKSNLSELYEINETRFNFPDYTPDDIGENSFPLLAERGIYIIDRVVQEEMKGGVDLVNDLWYIPDNGAVVEEGNSNY